jgi:hypothetical protein
MDILSGFQLEKPQVLVGWGISEEQLQELFRGSELRRVKDGYFFIRCTALCGLSHNVGFRFIPRINGSLVAFELAGNGCGSLEDSYREFQNHLETTFGRPTDTSLGAEGFPTTSGISKTFRSFMQFRSISDQPSSSESRRGRVAHASLCTYYPNHPPEKQVLRLR